MKTCNSCGAAKPYEFFGARKASADGFAGKCKQCTAAAAKQWRKKNPGANTESVRQWRLRNPAKVKQQAAKRDKKAAQASRIKHKYGLDNAAYLTMFADQGGNCAICYEALLLDGSKNEKPQVDHDHKTGKIRGLLCTKCNHGLGRFRDNTGYLESAISYLRRQP